MTEHLTYRFDWEEVLGAVVTDILGLNSQIMNDGSEHWDAVAIRIGEKAVLLTVDWDTDQVIASHEDTPSGAGWAPIASFGFARGQPLAWSWVGINYLGYKDCFSVAFGDDLSTALTPRCMFIAAASSLSCLDLKIRMA
jgi:hypothetical protein